MTTSFLVFNISGCTVECVLYYSIVPMLHCCGFKRLLISLNCTVKCECQSFTFTDYWSGGFTQCKYVWFLCVRFLAVLPALFILNTCKFNVLGIIEKDLQVAVNSLIYDSLHMCENVCCIQFSSREWYIILLLMIPVTSSIDSVPVTSVTVSVPSSSSSSSSTTSTHSTSVESVSAYTVQSPTEILSQLSKAGVLPTMSSSQVLSVLSALGADACHLDMEPESAHHTELMTQQQVQMQAFQSWWFETKHIVSLYFYVYPQNTNPSPHSISIVFRTTTTFAGVDAII